MGKKIGIIIFAALLIRLIAFGSFESENSLIHKDSRDYMNVAQNIVEKGVYSMDTGPDPKPDNFRTPLYPLFLIPFVAIDTSPYAIALAQDLIMTLGIVIIYLLARRIFEDKVAFWGTLLFALEPYTALLNNQMLTEWLFAITLIPSLLLLAAYLQPISKARDLYIGALLLALAALSKPMALPLLPFVLCVIVIIKRRDKTIWKSVALAAIVMAVTIAPWIARNKISIDRWSFSTIGEYNLYNYNAKHFNRWLIDRGETAGDNKYETISLENYHRPEKADRYLQAAKEFIFERPLLYTEFILIKLPALFLDTGYTTLTDGLGTRGVITDLINLVGSIFFFTMTVLAAINFALRLRMGLGAQKAIFITLTLFAFALVASPFGAARYRVALNPILFILALDTLVLLWPKKSLESSGQKLIHS